MREIFFEEKLGGTGRNSERARAVRVVGAVGCEPHGQGWIFGGEARRDFETLGETRSEGGDGGLKVGKERVVHFFWVGLIY